MSGSNTHAHTQTNSSTDVKQPRGDPVPRAQLLERVWLVFLKQEVHGGQSDETSFTHFKKLNFVKSYK